jgi:hypothetical protein
MISSGPAVRPAPMPYSTAFLWPSFRSIKECAHLPTAKKDLENESPFLYQTEACFSSACSPTPLESSPGDTRYPSSPIPEFSTLTIFYPGEIRPFDSLVGEKTVWSADSRPTIITTIADRPIYQLLKRLVHLLNPGFEQCATVVRFN